MRIAHPNGPTHQMGQALTLFAEEVSRGTDGAVAVERWRNHRTERARTTRTSKPR